jgi:pterin-4a-carbinolamine dehydratase
MPNETTPKHRSRRQKPAGGRKVTAKLKAERIQAARIAGRRKGEEPPGPGAKLLQRERFPQLLGELPGWRATRGKRALMRRFTFPSPRPAAAFAHFVAELAEASGHPAWVELRGNVAVVTVFIHRARGASLRDLQVASAPEELPA